MVVVNIVIVKLLLRNFTTQLVKETFHIERLTEEGVVHEGLTHAVMGTMKRRPKKLQVSSSFPIWDRNCTSLASVDEQTGDPTAPHKPCNHTTFCCRPSPFSPASQSRRPSSPPRYAGVMLDADVWLHICIHTYLHAYMLRIPAGPPYPPPCPM